MQECLAGLTQWQQLIRLSCKQQLMHRLLQKLHQVSTVHGRSGGLGQHSLRNCRSACSSYQICCIVRLSLSLMRTSTDSRPATATWQHLPTVLPQNASQITASHLGELMADHQESMSSCMCLHLQTAWLKSSIDWCRCMWRCKHSLHCQISQQKVVSWMTTVRSFSPSGSRLQLTTAWSQRLLATTGFDSPSQMPCIGCIFGINVYCQTDCLLID